jgi:predicted NAD/FAD-dependent oxidoreductase
VRSGRIAVVGAGIAGLAAARRLAQDHRDVVVFEKARGVGGRTSTRRSDGDAFDHGAQYFTCRTDLFRRQVDEWCRRGVAAVWKAPMRMLGGGAIASTGEGNIPYVGVPRMSSLTRDLATGLRVECGRRIERIEASPAGWRLAPESGPAPHGFDAVVVATPAPQAVSLLALVAPRLAALAAGVEMQPCHAVMVSFPEPLGVDFGGAFIAKPPLAWVARNASKPERPGRECWVLHADPEWSAHHLQAPAEAVAEALLQAFGEALGRELPSASFRTVHRWRFARAAQPLGAPFLWDADLRLGACGDWTLGARVEDAFTSGELLAAAMLGESSSTAIRA